MRNRILRYLCFLGVHHQRKRVSGKGLNRSKRRKRRDDPLSSDEGIENTNYRQNRMREREMKMFLKCPTPREGGARGLKAWWYKYYRYAALRPEETVDVLL